MALFDRSSRGSSSRRRDGNARGPQDVYARHQYKEVWNAQSSSEDDAKMAVSGYTDEAIYAQAGEGTVGLLRDTVGIGPDDVVLEIGAGVGRVGAALAPHCREWIGADVSENMLAHLRRRLKAQANVRAVALNGYDLSPIETASVDVVYATIVFMHLDEWDRFAYVREGMRVLRPGGRMFVDNADLTSDEGWAMFESLCAFAPADRPPQISKMSTPDELATYFRRAGFTGIQQRSQSVWIMTWGTKPAG